MCCKAVYLILILACSILIDKQIGTFLCCDYTHCTGAACVVLNSPDMTDGWMYKVERRTRVCYLPDDTSDQPSHLYREMMPKAKKCVLGFGLVFVYVCVIQCDCVVPLFMREINGGWQDAETNTEISAVCVGAIPATFKSTQCYFCASLPASHCITT